MLATATKRVKPGETELKDRLVSVNRVTKVTKGGRAFTASEPLDADDRWTRVPDAHVLIATADTLTITPLEGLQIGRAHV